VRDFHDAIRSTVAELRVGQIVSYGWVACEAGNGAAAKEVGRYLSKHSNGLPWWRVVLCTGFLAEPRAPQQAAMLRRHDKVKTTSDGRVLAEVLHTPVRECPDFEESIDADNAT
jgi:alkylated DNA nucleotide flippase Atl1